MDLANVEDCTIENEKIEKLQTCDLRFFIDTSYFSNDGPQNFLIFQPISRLSTMSAGLKDKS